MPIYQAQNDEISVANITGIFQRDKNISSSSSSSDDEDGSVDTQQPKALPLRSESTSSVYSSDSDAKEIPTMRPEMNAQAALWVSL